MSNSIPLYQLAANKQLGPMETMDQETLDWIREESKDYQLTTPVNGKYLNLEDLTVIKNLIPDSSLFSNSQHSMMIHGLRHTIRVMTNSVMISNLMKIEEETKIIQLIAASLHDLMRINDNEDSNHGMRAADWFQNHLSRFATFIDIEEEAVVNTVHSLIAYHDVDYPDLPSHIDQDTVQQIHHLKAADALDRFVQPKQKWWPKPEYIKLAHAHVLLPVSRQITLESEQKKLNGLTDTEAVYSTITEILL